MVKSIIAMILQHWVFHLCLLFPFLMASSYMQGLRVASLNVNGCRDANKRALLAEVIKQKRLDIVFKKHILTVQIK